MNRILARFTRATSKGFFLFSIGVFAPAPQLRAQSGAPLWTNQYAGPVAGGYDQPSALVCDSVGNVIVTGYIRATNSHSDYGTVKYSSAGVPLWTNTFNGFGDNNDNAAAIAVNTNGDVFVTGTSVFINGPYFTTHYTTLAYSAAGLTLWTNYYGYGNTLNPASAITVNANGQVVVTGSSIGGQGRYSYATIAYATNGVPLWTNRYNGGQPVELDAHATAIAPDKNGNVFITGYSTAWSSGYDYATVKYSGAGVPLWTNRYDGPANGNDYARAIAVDGTGNVFVTGYSTNKDSGYDYVTVAYSNNGTPLWTNIYNGPDNGHDYALGIALDAAGNVFVAGYSTNSSGTHVYATVAYSNAGTPLWTNRYNGPGNEDDYACAIAVDRGGNVFVTGYSSNAANSFDYVSVAYSNSGLPLWTNVFGGPLTGQAFALALDADGNLFVTGISFGSGQDYTTIKYSSILPPPARLSLQLTNNELVLEWAGSGLALQAAPGIAGPFTNVLGATSPYKVPLSQPQQFFRLICN